MIDRSDANRLLQLVRDQIEADKSSSTASLYRIGNGEHVVRIATEQADWWLWDFSQWTALRRKVKAKAEQQRKAKKQREEASA